MIKTIYSNLVALAILGATFACQSSTEVEPVLSEKAGELSIAGDENARKVNSNEFGAFLTGTEEVVPVSAPGSGAASLSVTEDGSAIQFEVRVANITGITMAHLHRAPFGTNGGVVVTLIPTQAPSGLENGVVAEGIITEGDLSGFLAGKPLSALVEDMKNGLIYVNVHTATNPGGQIRGQVSVVLPELNKNFVVHLDGKNEVPSVTSKASGLAIFQFDAMDSSLDFQINLNQISDVRFSHIHLAKAGANGPVVVDLRMDKVIGNVSGVYAKGTITADQLKGLLLGGDLAILKEALRTGNAYVNVHSDNFPGGEVRGQF
ncbi:CHRD domain-containing protein [Algoriphagus terrigena]|uniref:CHRD domain-containing protein n=1 Tax=Algoriphagus terrigena TaxID=344884 RepID=UPI000414031F|nr:CHRD domain-containing protein [Algoriphagus terrigena]